MANVTPELSPQLQAALSRLNDIVVPPPVGWWPISDSLIALFIGIGGILIGSTWYFLNQRKQNQYRRQAQSLFDNAIAQSDDPRRQLQIANQLLKQVAITSYGRKQVAALTGEDWIHFLKQNASYVQQPDGLEACFASLYNPNQPLEPQDIQQTLDYVKHWIRGHHK
jgi:hypothetical protein